MGLILKTVNNFEDSLKRTIGEEPVPRYRVTKSNEVVFWYEGIETYDDAWHELNYAKSYSPAMAKIELIESLTSDCSATFRYYDGNGELIEFYWNKDNKFVRI